jgi:hypothetical protein
MQFSILEELIQKPEYQNLKLNFNPQARVFFTTYKNLKLAVVKNSYTRVSQKELGWELDSFLLSF